jgi:hypothetical protein
MSIVLNFFLIGFLSSLFILVFGFLFFYIVHKIGEKHERFE